MATDVVHVDVLNPTSPLLAAVVALGDENAHHVGLFPRSCFEREAGRKRILIATGSDGSLSGYLLYRVARNRAVIQQLCVHPQARGAGVARALFERLKSVTRHLDGIALHCARDFPAHSIWPKLGFTPHGEKPGRGQVDRTLTRFWYDHGHQGLFSAPRAGDERIAVVMDANVAYAVQDEDKECTALHGDWLLEEIELCITSEIYHEIDRHDDSGNRERRRGYVHSLRQVAAPDDVVEQVFGELHVTLGHSQTRSGKSDLRHLAIAIAGGARMFVTRDSGLLGHAATVEDRYGLRVVRPAELIAGMDEEHRADTYAPNLLGGSAVKVRRIAATDLSDIVQGFLCTGAGERRTAFERTLGDLCSHPLEVEPLVFEHPEGTPVAVCVVDLRTAGHADIRICRVRPGPIAATMAYFLATQSIRSAAAHGRVQVTVSDKCPPASLAGALESLGFIREGEAWSRVVRSGVHAAADLPGTSGDPLAEQRLWPAKLLGAGVKSFIVPIQPHWVRELVGSEGHDLFGGDPRLILSPESVYYRSARAGVVTAPGRILWYESRGGGPSADGRQAIVACSTVLGTEIGPGKEIFRRYSRLGILDWKHVDEIAQGHPEGKVMAVRYGLTEHFRNPPRRRQVQDALKRQLGYGNPLMTAVEVPEACFAELYRAGMGLAS